MYKSNVEMKLTIIVKYKLIHNFQEPIYAQYTWFNTNIYSYYNKNVPAPQSNLQPVMGCLAI